MLKKHENAKLMERESSILTIPEEEVIILSELDVSVQKYEDKFSNLATDINKLDYKMYEEKTEKTIMIGQKEVPVVEKITKLSLIEGDKTLYTADPNIIGAINLIEKKSDEDGMIVKDIPDTYMFSWGMKWLDNINRRPIINDVEDRYIERIKKNCPDCLKFILEDRSKIYEVSDLQLIKLLKAYMLKYSSYEYIIELQLDENNAIILGIKNCEWARENSCPES